MITGDPDLANLASLARQVENMLSQRFSYPKAGISLQIVQHGAHRRNQSGSFGLKQHAQYPNGAQPELNGHLAPAPFVQQYGVSLYFQGQSGRCSG